MSRIGAPSARLPDAPARSSTVLSASTTPLKTERPSEPRQSESPAQKQTDWGLAAPAPRSRWKLTTALVATLIVSGTAAYIAWNKLFRAPEPALSVDERDDSKREPAADQSTVGGEESLADAEFGTHQDPFEEASSARPAMASSRSSRIKLAEGTDEEVALQPIPAARRPAGPAHRATPADTADDEFLSALPDDVQTEPDIEDNSGPDDPPDRPTSTIQRAGAPIVRPAPKEQRGPQPPPDEESDPVEIEVAQPGGPRLSQPRFPDSPSGRRGDDDERLEGFVIDDAPAARGNERTTGPAISLAESTTEPADDDLSIDERLDGFVPESPQSPRATSRTVVTRAAGEAAQGGDSTGSATAISGDSPPREAGTPARLDTATIQKRPSPPVARPDARSGAPGQPRSAEPSSALRSETYSVGAGDSFWSISRKVYGTARYYQALARHNLDRVSDPQRLKPGVRLSTPAAGILESKYPSLIERSSAPSGGAAPPPGGGRPAFEKPEALKGFDDHAVPAVAGDKGGSSEAAGYFYSRAGDPMYRIGPDDTLTGIAQKHLGRASRWGEIFEKNREILSSPDNLPLGTVIRLPPDASRLSLVSEPERRR